MPGGAQKTASPEGLGWAGLDWAGGFLFPRCWSPLGWVGLASFYAFCFSGMGRPRVQNLQTMGGEESEAVCKLGRSLVIKALI